MSTIHEKDRESIDEAARGLSLLAGYSPEIRERVQLVVELVYAKGQLRGYQQAVETSATLLGLARTEPPTETHQVSEQRATKALEK